MWQRPCFVQACGYCRWRSPGSVSGRKAANHRLSVRASHSLTSIDHADLQFTNPEFCHRPYDPHLGHLRYVQVQASLAVSESRTPKSLSDLLEESERRSKTWVVEPVDSKGMFDYHACICCVRARPMCALSSKWHNRVCLVFVLLWSFHLVTGAWGARASRPYLSPLAPRSWRSRSISQVSSQTWRKDGNEDDLGWRALFCGEQA